MKRLTTQELLQMLEYIRVRSQSEKYRQALKQAEDTLRNLLCFDGKAKPGTGTTGSNITSDHKEWFEACRDAPNMALFSCFVDGQPSSAIVAVVPQEDGSFNIMPLFVTINDHMRITDHDGVQPNKRGGEPASTQDH